MDSNAKSRPHVYSSLPRPDSFGLLDLEPAADEHDPLQGSLNTTTLENVDVDLVTRYTALSYVWGNPTPVGSIAIDGSSDVGITSNLTQALRDIHHTSRAIVLWVDALCINQQDPKERSHQVRIMGDIYRRAATTTIYLGPHRRNVQFLFNHIAAVNLERRRLQTEDPVSDDFDSNLHSGSRSNLGNDSPGSSEVSQSDPKAAPETTKLWLAIHEICSNDWFTRAWTFPELVLSVDPRIQFGRMLARWADVASVVESLWDGKERSAYPSRPSVFLKLDQATQGKGEDTMSNLIRARAGVDVTDPRDFFYCLLGIAKDRREWAGTIRADYNVSTPSLYASVAHEMLHRGDIMLGVLLSSHSAANHGPIPVSRLPLRHSLPSWVPDWGITAYDEVSPRYIRPDSLSTQGQVGDLDGVLVLPFWPGGPKRIERLSGWIPTSWIGKSDVEPIARAAAEVLQVPFDPQRKTESSVYRLLDSSMAHFQSYDNWYQSERGEKHHRAAVNDDHQYFLPFESALEMGNIGGVGATLKPGDKNWNKLLQFENGLEDDGFISDGTKLFRLAILHNGEAAAVPTSSEVGDEVFTTFMSPTKQRESRQWVACVGRPVSGFEATNEAIARYAKQQFLKPLKRALDPGRSDGKSIPGSHWASLGPFADKAPALKQVQADLALEEDLFDIRHYRVLGIAVDTSAPCSLHARASSHYVAIH